MSARVLILLVYIGLAAAQAAAAQEVTFIEVGGAVPAQVERESCPIRVELPLAPLFAGKTRTYLTAKTSSIRCEGGYVSLVTLERHDPRNGLRPRLHAQVRFVLARGGDRTLRIRYWLAQGDEVLANGQEEMEADEGDANWEDGVDLWYRASPGLDPARLSLRIEAAYIDPDAPPPAPDRACSTDQILKMKAAGVTDEQVKAICGG